jgi:hypothetical protein
MQYLWLFHDNNGFENEGQYAYWILRTFPVSRTNKQMEE